MNTKIITALTILLFSFVSCQDEFLTEDAFDIVTPLNFYQTEADAQAGLLSVYNVMVSSDDTHRRSIWMVGDYPSEAVNPNKSGDPWRMELDEFTWTPNSGVCQNVWRGMYRGIRRANTLLSQIENITFASDAVKNQVIGETRFLRGMFYLTLLQTYDFIPVITETDDQNDLYPTNDGTTDRAWEVIIEDFKYAEANLPILPKTGKNVGRASKGAAKAMLARAYLNRAGFPWNKADHWALAAAKAKEIMDTKATYSYDLVSDYAKVFEVATEHGAEYIFSVEFESGIGLGSNIPAMTGIRNGDQTKILGGWTSFVSSEQFFKTFDDTDKRKAKTFVISYTSIKGTQYTYPGNITIAHLNKFVDVNESKVTGTGDFATNMPVIRYADVLLMHSEAENMANGPSATAVDGINQVRARAGLAAIDPTKVTKEELRQLIIEERAKEFVGESLTFFDYKRQHVLIERAARGGQKALDKHYALPIPQTELDLNPNLKQNPNWL